MTSSSVLPRRVPLCLALLATFVTVGVGPAGAQGTGTGTKTARPLAGPAPLIDRELFFGNPEITGAQLSPDGKYVAFIKPYKDTRNVWVKKADEPFTAAHLVSPVAVDLGGPLFADGAGAFSAIGTLPLADGFTALYRNFGIQKQKVDVKQARVVGTEDVTVPAGTFKAWKVELSAAAGDPGVTTLWVAQDSRKVVKIAATLPAMNGATMTSELTQ